MCSSPKVHGMPDARALGSSAQCVGTVMEETWCAIERESSFNSALFVFSKTAKIPRDFHICLPANMITIVA